MSDNNKRKAPDSPAGRKGISIKIQGSSGIKKKSKAKVSHDDCAVVVQHVIPDPLSEKEGGLTGFVVTPTNFSDYFVKTTMYAPKNDDFKAGFMEATACLSKSVASQKDGNPIVNQCKGRDIPRCALVVLADVTEEEVRTHVNNNIKQSVMAADEQFRDPNDDPLSEETLPKMRENQDYSVVHHWSDVLYKPADVEFVISQNGEMNTKSCLKKDPKNICQCWKEGEVPLSVMNKCGLRGEHLRPMDKQRLIDDMNAQAQEAIAGLHEEASDKVLKPASPKPSTRANRKQG